MATAPAELESFAAPILAPLVTDREVDDVVAMCRRAARANRSTPARRGNVIELSSSDVEDVLISADLHGHWDNFRAILQAADLDAHPRRHLVLQEVCHGGPEYRPGACSSHAMLEAVAELKLRYPDRVHFLLSNHELSELTSHPIRKDGRLALLSFMLGLNHRYGGRADDVHAACMEFVASCPIGVRIGRDVFVCHSAPAAVDANGFDASVLERPWKHADLETHGAVYKLVWGRDYRPENAAAFAQAVDARLLVLGHTPCEAGHLVANEQQLILDCSSRPAAALLVPGDGASSMDELLKGLFRLGESRPPRAARPIPETLRTVESPAPVVPSPDVRANDAPADAASAQVVESPRVAPTLPPMINTALHDAMKIQGALAVALLDAADGTCLAKMGGYNIDLDACTFDDAELLRAKTRSLEKHGRASSVEEIIVALPDELEVIRTIGRDRQYMFFLLLDRKNCNQAFALRKLSLIERALDA